jgi:hypothetical protein
MGELISIHKKRKFSESEAESILPIVKRITERTVSSIHDLESQIKFVPCGEPLRTRLQHNIETLISQWADKMMRLGCAPVGLWVVNFDADPGCFSWRYGDENLNYFNSIRIT